MEEKTTSVKNVITFKDIIRLLLGNKWLYLLLAGIFTVVSVFSLIIYNDYSKNYVSFFDYEVAGFLVSRDEHGKITATFVDGSKFDQRSLLTKDKIEKYVASDERLSGLDAEELYYDGGVRALEYTTLFKTAEGGSTERTDPDAVEKPGYKLILSGTKLRFNEAVALTECIANEVLEISREKILSLKYDRYLNLYAHSNSFSDQADYLHSCVEFLEESYDKLIEEYGDITVKAGQYGGDGPMYYLEKQTVSDIKDQMSRYFINSDIDALKSEIELNGYIDEDAASYISQLKAKVSSLNRVIQVNTGILDSLVAQRDDLIASAAGVSIESLEISAYNQEIIALTKMIAEDREQVEKANLSLSKLDVSSMTQEEYEEYSAKLEAFKAEIGGLFDALVVYTNQYAAVSREIMLENVNVYFDNSQVVAREGGIGTKAILAVSLAVGIFGPMIFNLLVSAFRVAEGRSLIRRRASKKKETEE